MLQFKNIKVNLFWVKTGEYYPLLSALIQNYLLSPIKKILSTFDILLYSAMQFHLNPRQNPLFKYRNKKTTAPLSCSKYY